MRGIGDTTDNVEGARSTLFRDKTALPAIPQIGSFNSRRAARCEPKSSLKSASPQLPRLLKFGGALCWYQVIAAVPAVISKIEPGRLLPASLQL